MLLLRDFIFNLIIFLLCLYKSSLAENRVITVNLERPVVEYVNSSFARVLNVTSRRYSRRDPLYYVHIYAETFVTITKNYTVHLTIDEFLSYTSKRRYLDLDLNLCNFLTIVGNNVLYKKNIEEEFEPIKHKVHACILPIGFYNFYNLTWPMERAPPLGVYFQQGRLGIKISCNDAVTVGYGHVDLEFKELPKRKV